MITTREALIAALREAAELEHGLLIQYFYAAVSFKKRLDEGLSPQQAEAARGWEGQLLKIARDEMAHLGTVCNMLSAVGAPPHFGRPNFPQPENRYYPFPFSLEPFSGSTIYRFMRFEQPKGERLPPPIDRSLALAARVEYDYVGELYRAIEAGFEEMDERDLFIGPRYAQDVDDWANPGRFRLLLVKDRRTAKLAIDFIVKQGEGASGAREGSHFDVFVNMWKGYMEAGEPALARPVVSNPRTQPLQDAADGGTVITNERSKAVAELFSNVYEAALYMLTQYYSYAGETPTQRTEVQLVLRTMMSAVIRPIAEVLTEMPVSDANVATGNAGPSFEITGPTSVPTNLPNRWTLLIEQMDAASRRAAELAPIAGRLAFIAENLEWLAVRVKRAALEGTV